MVLLLPRTTTTLKKTKIYFYPNPVYLLKVLCIVYVGLHDLWLDASSAGCRFVQCGGRVRCVCCAGGGQGIICDLAEHIVCI